MVSTKPARSGHAKAGDVQMRETENRAGKQDGFACYVPRSLLLEDLMVTQNSPNSRE
jgi:hypothetical protein